MKLTTNFSKEEFDSHDGAQMSNDILGNIKMVAQNLQVLRDYFGKPIKVNSGYRSPEHNAKVGGSPSSQHKLGKAADIVVSGETPERVLETIEQLIDTGQMQQGGLGLYDTFVHYDIRGTKARWDYSKNK
ncbi:hypothetical protein NBRC110019_21010 [Neptunitalea chrysea]|uniref:Peptidase M15A C-terminal domain-containing protein n=1 Tax=Neptunitalea chrysea TaxID=1647581 RepID=A0A9W6EVL1_9FLAO|nr:D-Ala-D-Ala carboxypeptidase family metallohydrolase [Neptunitalea chrysea]GLB53061.1 hypothetical protein NBRC110019_21010 [Neptunitalea chrysea]